MNLAGPNRKDPLKLMTFFQKHSQPYSIIRLLTSKSPILNLVNKISDLFSQYLDLLTKSKYIW